MDTMHAMAFSSFSIIIISFTVLFSDHLLSFADEIELIWKKKKTPFSFLFLLNRYFTLAVMALFVICSFSLFPVHTEHEPGLGVFEPSSQPILVFVFMSAITTLVAEATLVLRIYAVYDRNKIILGILLLIWMAHLSLMALVVKRMDVLFTPLPFRTTNPFNSAHSFNFITLRGHDSMMFILPAIIFDVTAGAFLTFGLYRRSGSYRSKMPLIKLIIRDGLLYFAIVFVTNIAWLSLNIYLSWFGVILSLELNFVPLEGWSACITTIMIGRLTLNLRMYDPAANNELTFGDITQSLRFGHSHEIHATENGRTVEGYGPGEDN